MRVHIIGGGVIGMMTARALALAGVEVVLLERTHLAAEASWAGGGIMSPLYPWRHPSAVDVMARQSQDLYPGLAQSLLASTGIDPEWQPGGMFMFAVDDVAAAQDWAQRVDVELQLLSAEELQQRLPAGPHAAAALFMPGLAHVRNPRLLAALAADLRRLAVVIEEASEVVDFQQSQGRVQALLLADGRHLSVETVVACAGAWTGRLLARAQQNIAIHPVHGEMLCYAPGTAPAPASILMHDAHYLIPRRDGHLLVGSTVALRDFDKSTTTAARQQLMQIAGQLWPALAGQSPAWHWAGLRPGSAQGIPIVAESPVRGLWVHAGHFRNGLILAPASTRLLVEQLLGQACSLPPQPYAWPDPASSPSS